MQHPSSEAPAASVSCDGPVPVVGSEEGIRAVFYKAGPDAIYLLTAYAKADREDLTPGGHQGADAAGCRYQKKEYQGK